MEQEHINRVEAYFKGTLSAAGKKQLVADMKNDPQLKELFNEYDLAQATIDRQVEKDLRDQFRDWGAPQEHVEAEKETTTRTIAFPSIWKVAASLVFVIGISYVFFISYQEDPTNRELALAAHEIPLWTGGTMGKGSSELWGKGMHQFQEKDYAGAIEYWSGIPEPTDEMRYFKAHAYFLLDSGDRAADLFEALSITSNNYTAGANWNLLLTYLANEDSLKFHQQLDKVLSSGNETYRKKTLKLAEKSKF